MKVLFVYALLIGFAAAAKIDKKKNEKKRDHHVGKRTEALSPDLNLEDPISAVQAKRRKMTMKLRRQTERLIKASRKAKARAIRSSRRSRSRRHKSRKERKNRKERKQRRKNEKTRFSGISKLKNFDAPETRSKTRRKAEMPRFEAIRTPFRSFDVQRPFSRLAPNGHRFS